MLKPWMYLAVGALLTGSAWPQDAMPPNQGGTRTIVGCLSKLHHGEYVITAEGPGPKQFRVTGGDTASLHKLVEHTVRVSGVVGQSDPAVQAITPPNPGSTTGATYNTITLDQVQDVTSNCSIHGSESTK